MSLENREDPVRDLFYSKANDKLIIASEDAIAAVNLDEEGRFQENESTIQLQYKYANGVMIDERIHVITQELRNDENKINIYYGIFEINQDGIQTIQEETFLNTVPIQEYVYKYEINPQNGIVLCTNASHPLTILSLNHGSLLLREDLKGKLFKYLPKQQEFVMATYETLEKYKIDKNIEKT